MTIRSAIYQMQQSVGTFPHGKLRNFAAKVDADTVSETNTVLVAIRGNYQIKYAGFRKISGATQTRGGRRESVCLVRCRHHNARRRSAGCRALLPVKSIHKCAATRSSPRACPYRKSI